MDKLIQLGIETTTRSQGYLSLICPYCLTYKSYRKVDWAKTDDGLVCVSCSDKIKEV